MFSTQTDLDYWKLGLALIAKIDRPAKGQNERSLAYHHLLDHGKEPDNHLAMGIRLCV